MEARPVVAPAPVDVLGPAGARVPFRHGDREVTCTEALEALDQRGGWDEVLRDAARGERALAAADSDVRSEVEDRLPVTETALRRRLGVTAADDYLAWLDQHGLTVADCRDHLRRHLASDLLASGSPASGPVGADVDASTTAPDAAAVRAHVVIDGVLDAAVRRLAEDAALADVDPGSRTWLAEVVGRAAAERARAPELAEVMTLLSQHAVDWTHVRATVALVPDADVARELLLCVHEQRAPLATVASDVGVNTVSVDTVVGALEPWLEPLLLGAEPGALLGPVARDEGSALVEVVERRHPDAADAASVRLATEELLRRRIAGAMASHVRWTADA